MEKSDLFLNTYVQHGQDFKVWVLAVRNAHRISENEIVNFSVVKPEVFREEIYSRSFETYQAPEEKKDGVERWNS